MEDEDREVFDNLIFVQVKFLSLRCRGEALSPR